MCKDYEQCDEDGYLTDLYRLNYVSDQNMIIDMGLEWEEVHEIILDFENERAHAMISHDECL